MKQSFTLPVPPSLNACYGNRNGGGRGRFPMPAYKAWQKAAGWGLHLAKPRPVTGPYTLSLALPANMRGDVDNRVKPTADLLVKMRVTPDDKYMSIGSVDKSAGMTGFMIVTIEGEAA